MTEYDDLLHLYLLLPVPYHVTEDSAEWFPSEKQLQALYLLHIILH
jgi:hypothetical protein